MTEIKEKILWAVGEDLAAIEDELVSNLSPQYELVADTAKHIIFSGGKRLRPLLTVLTARLCGYRGIYDRTLSVVFEYLHAATLLHDDLVDGARVRRGQPTAHGIWGNATAVLVGDFLLARSLSIAARSGKLAIIESIAKITELMSQGEIQQLSQKGNLALLEGQYMEVIAYKTATLIQGACRAGAILAEAPSAHEDALATYGFQLGMAFQIADDLLDYTADADTLGKEVGTDLKEGKLTLPIIHALGRADKEKRIQIERIIRAETFTEFEFKQLVSFMHRCGSIEYAKDKAAEFIQCAKGALDVFQPSPERETLIDLADYAIFRTH